MATYYEISSLPKVNEVNPDKVEKIKKSILNNGWKGAPILYTDMGLVTGSHRLTALQEIEKYEEDDDVLFDDIAEDVTDIVDEYCGSHDTYWDELDFANLQDIFAGTRVEEYKDEIEEW